MHSVDNLRTNASSGETECGPPHRSAATIYMKTKRCRFPSISVRDEGFFISFPSPRPRFKRQSAHVWPARRWAQYEITFRALLLTLQRFPDVWFCDNFFLLLLDLAPDSSNEIGTFGQPYNFTYFRICMPLPWRDHPLDFFQIFSVAPLQLRKFLVRKYVFFVSDVLIFLLFLFVMCGFWTSQV